MADEFRSRPAYRFELARTYNNLGRLLIKETGRRQDAESAFGKALKLQQQLADDYLPMIFHEGHKIGRTQRLLRATGDLDVGLIGRLAREKP